MSDFWESNFWKALRIQTIIIVASFIVAAIFSSIFYARGLYTLASMGMWIPGFALGSYVLFGKYPDFAHFDMTKKGVRRAVGICIILFMPIIWFAHTSSERVERERR